MNKNTISLLGYGWLGTPLARSLQNAGFTVRASTTTAEKLDSISRAGLQPYLLKLNPELHCDDDSFFESEILVVNFPPKRRADIIDFHTRQIIALIHKIESSAISKVLFISSTSVYAGTGGVVTEEHTDVPEKLSGQALRIAEELLINNPNFKTTVIRFAGLIGNDRVPGRFLAGKKDIANADAPVNLIHQDDCVAILHQIIEQEIWGDVFNASMPMHPTRREFYVRAAEIAHLECPQFSSAHSTGFKIIDSSKLVKRLGYHFKYKNPIDIL